jgi:hypothetical protein
MRLGLSSSTSWLGAPLGRREGWVIGTVVLVAFLARAWDIGGASLNHYDEGVYAFTAWGLADAERTIHPEQRNAPIGSPFLSSLAFRALGRPSDMAAIGLNVAIGTLSILVVWAVARRWFGPVAAVAAATLLAFNELHVALSRSGMTDVLFGLVFAATLPVVSAALQRPGLGLTVAAGLMTGAAWNTKIHGFLAPVIVASGLVPVAWFAGWTRREYLGAFWRGVGLTVVAIACYVPWTVKAASLSGGLVDLVEFQLGPVNTNWLGNFERYAMHLWYFEGLLARASVPAALAAIAVLEPRATHGPWRWAVLAAGAGGVMLGSTITVWLLTALAVPVLMRRRDAGAWILLAWGASLLVLSPVYRPHVRKVLPLVIAGSVAAGVVLSHWAERLAATAPESARARGRWRMPAITVAMAVLILVVGAWRGDAARWRRSRDLPEAARQIRQVVGAGAKVIVIGEAALAFYLEAEGVRAFKGYEYWETVVEEKQPVYVVTGIYIQRAPTLRKNYEILRDRLELLADYPFLPYDNRLLETFDASAALAFLRDRQDDYRLRLYRYTPDPTGEVPELVKF